MPAVEEIAGMFQAIDPLRRDIWIADYVEIMATAVTEVEHIGSFMACLRRLCKSQLLLVDEEAL